MEVIALGLISTLKKLLVQVVVETFVAHLGVLTTVQRSPLGDRMRAGEGVMDPGGRFAINLGTRLEAWYPADTKLRNG